MGIRSRKLKLSLAAVGVFAVGAVAGGVAISEVKKDPPAPKYNSLARTVNPIGGKNRALGLSRVVIQPGAKIPLHYHEGTQVSYIQSGVLTYTVHTGRVRVMTGPGDDGTLVRVIKAGQTGKIKAGQWIKEVPSERHSANNYGKKKIVIYLANLLKKNASPSTLVP
ncbi:MAG: cupin domain-containing protein [Solirubrobacterales bacterium]